jgi:hypothetical protein
MCHKAEHDGDLVSCLGFANRLANVFLHRAAAVRPMPEELAVEIRAAPHLASLPICLRVPLALQGAPALYRAEIAKQNTQRFPKRFRDVSGGDVSGTFPGMPRAPKTFPERFCSAILVFVQSVPLLTLATRRPGDETKTPL